MESMKRTIGLYAFGGALIGALIGLLFSSGGGNPLSGFALGAAAGMFLGWFAGAAVTQKSR